MKSKKFKVPDLQEEATISLDQWGIPHIRAHTKSDLFFAQGFNAARDRLWQIDLWRKRGLGLLASDFGPGYIEQDKACRLFLYRGDMDAEWASYAPDAEEIAQSFVNGINAYVALVNDGSIPPPPEFAIFGTRPANWLAEDVVRIRSHSLMRNALSEVVRANVISRVGSEIDLLRQALVPAKECFVADGIKLDEVPLEVTDTFKLALSPVTFDDDRLSASLEDAKNWSKIAATGEVIRDAAAQGSNNWVISGAKTESGRPILANDPHRAHAVPSLRYLVHLTCHDFDVIGAGEPCLPGICIGHNGKSAFGLTLFFGHDQEDVYVYETSPSDPELYRYNGHWEHMRVVREKVTLKGGEAVELRLLFTRHGPVVFQDCERKRAYAIRSVWSDPGTAPYFASIASMRAESFEEFRTAMERWGVPATNQVYADTTGEIGWVAAGFSPVRPNWDGLLPVPGDGRFEWKGYLPAKTLPHTTNPGKGFWATANEPNLPGDWDHGANQIGYEWLERSRADRIEAVLAANGNHTMRSSADLQIDATSLVARRLTKVLDEVDLQGHSLGGVRFLLRDWDHRLESDSPAAALFEVWWTKHLRPGLFSLLTDDPVIQSLLLPGDPASIVPLIEKPDRLFGDDPVKARDHLVRVTLLAAVAECNERLGENPAQWKWGDLHEAHFVHATSSALKDTPRPFGDVGPFKLGGSDSSPMNATYRASDFGITVGASVRIVVDVGEWDNSICINTPGQSGDPQSPHYGDLADVWAQGKYVPLLYSATSVDKATKRRFKLIPSEK